MNSYHWVVDNGQYAKHPDPAFIMKKMSAQRQVNACRTNYNPEKNVITIGIVRIKGPQKQDDASSLR